MQTSPRRLAAWVGPEIPGALGRLAVKSRFTRSAGRAAPSAAMVVMRHRRRDVLQMEIVRQPRHGALGLRDALARELMPCLAYSVDTKVLVPNAAVPVSEPGAAPAARRQTEWAPWGIWRQLEDQNVDYSAQVLRHTRTRKKSGRPKIRKRSEGGGGQAERCARNGKIRRACEVMAARYQCKRLSTTMDSRKRGAYSFYTLRCAPLAWGQARLPLS